ncbi:MAG: hypothetical protein ABIK99_04340 [candidate division WOR-3 bacterium]
MGKVRIEKRRVSLPRGVFCSSSVSTLANLPALVIKIDPPFSSDEEAMNSLGELESAKYASVRFLKEDI